MENYENYTFKELVDEIKFLTTSKNNLYKEYDTIREEKWQLKKDIRDCCKKYEHLHDTADIVEEIREIIKKE